MLNGTVFQNLEMVQSEDNNKFTHGVYPVIIEKVFRLEIVLYMFFSHESIPPPCVSR